MERKGSPIGIGLGFPNSQYIFSVNSLHLDWLENVVRTAHPLYDIFDLGKSLKALLTNMSCVGCSNKVSPLKFVVMTSSYYPNRDHILGRKHLHVTWDFPGSCTNELHAINDVHKLIYRCLVHIWWSLHGVHTFTLTNILDSVEINLDVMDSWLPSNSFNWAWDPQSKRHPLVQKSYQRSGWIKMHVSGEKRITRLGRCFYVLLALHSSLTPVPNF